MPGEPGYPQTDRELLESVYTRLAVLEDRLNRLLVAWSVGGIRGLRAAAKDGGSSNGR